MKVIEQYYGPIRLATWQTMPEASYSFDQMECYIRVEVNGRLLHVRNLVHKHIPSKIALRDCQRSIMLEVERHVFCS